ncbi:MAG: ATP-dependent Clp protease proteolytic subunit, partial [Lentisphaeria bacterium]|nr:ATP-dependent Clp protease proteolytic subunit [Lentisphaeria bacterium]
ILKMRQKLNGIIAHHSGASLAKVSKDTDRDFFMSAEEAAKYGLIDHVLAHRGTK